MTEAEKIAAGGKLSLELSQAQLLGASVANRRRAEMSAQDVAALSAFRDHQLQLLVAQVEDSDEGAAIRWQVARDVYARHVEQALVAAMKG